MDFPTIIQIKQQTTQSKLVIMDGKLVCVYVKVKATWADIFLLSAACDDLSSARNENFRTFSLSVIDFSLFSFLFLLFPL